MSNLEELEKDLEELKFLFEKSQRQKNRYLLDTEIINLSKKIKEEEQVSFFLLTIEKSRKRKIRN
jgi:hypothetical protein